MISLCCHFNCAYVGSGRIGNGGLGTCSSKDMQILFCWSSSEMNMKKEHHSLAMMFLNDFFGFGFGVWFCLRIEGMGTKS